VDGKRAGLLFVGELEGGCVVVVVVDGGGVSFGGEVIFDGDDVGFVV
jgi:hypothetical protein